MRALAARILATSVLASLLAVAAHAAPGADKKRREPVDVPPVVAGGLKFEAPRLGTPFGYDQDGGIVTARRADSGVLLWTRRIYEVAIDPAMESDKQDVFIQRMVLSADGRRLVIVNERGRTFELGLDGGGLRALP